MFSAQASLNNAQAALNDTKLFAPTSGTIASLASCCPATRCRRVELQRVEHELVVELVVRWQWLRRRFGHGGQPRRIELVVE